MFANSRSSNSTPWAATFFALLGLLWCGYVAFPTSTPCTTAGCALFQDSKIFNISLWWIGGAAFLILTILCLRGYRHLAWQFARLALALDCILLVVMFFSATCVYCLVVAALFALTLFSLRHQRQGGLNGRATTEISIPILLPLWLGLFLGNTALVIDEVADRWVIAGPESAQISVYFSPSCAYCHNALIETAGRARLLPVIKDEGDLEAILRLEALLHQGVPMPEALTRSKDPNEPAPDVSMSARAYYSIQLLRNKAYVFKHGHGVLPLVVVEGGPAGENLGAKKPAANGEPAPVEAVVPPENQETRQPAPAEPPLSDGPMSGSDGQAAPAPVLPWDASNRIANCPEGSTAPCD